MSIRGAWVVALASAAIFIALGAVRLDAPGLNYDELNQAVGAFELQGQQAPLFARGRVFGFPLLVQPWSGALKTHLFGLWLAVSGAPFTAVSWRLFGLGLGALGLCIFLRLVAPRLTSLQTFVVAALLISDTTLRLHSRYEVGPVALALALRLGLVAAMVAAARSKGPAPGAALAMGLLVGLSIFEKLSAVVLLCQVALALVALTPLQSARARLLFLGGLAVGTVPLAAANLASWFAEGTFISLASAWTREYPLLSAADYAFGFLSLGAGNAASQMFLGTSAPLWLPPLEGVALAIGLFCAAAAGSDRLRWVMLASAAGIALGLALLPKGTAEHHWAQLSPFQYLALALALGSSELSARRRAVLGAALAVLLTQRAARTAEIELQLARGQFSAGWSPALTSFAEAAAREPDSAIFVAAEWGLATQLFALGQGREDHVVETYWAYPGPQRLAEELSAKGKSTAYIVALDPPPLDPTRTEHIFRDARAWPGWRPAAVPASLSGLPGIRILALER